MIAVISETADPALRPRSARCTRSRGRRSLGLASGSSHRRRRTTLGLPYTNNGDLSNKSNGTLGYQFGYDLSSNLRYVQLTGGSASGVDYLIDGINRRMGRAVTSGSGTVMDGLLYDEQGRVVAELDGSNNVLSTFIYGLKPNVPDYMVRGGVAYRIVSDWRGDVRLVLDTTKTGAAAVVEQIDYDEWGNVVNLVDPACSLGGTALCFQPFGFAGGVWDVTTGVVRFEARDYDPATRRWTQKDPIRFGGGWDLYVYAGDDPINGSDPSGRLDDAICRQAANIAYVDCLQRGGGPFWCFTFSGLVYAACRLIPESPPNVGPCGGGPPPFDPFSPYTPTVPDPTQFPNGPPGQ